MTLKYETIEKTRAILLALTGLACALYAALAFFQGRPNPIYWWIPGAMGVCASLGITLMVFWAGKGAAEMAMDELYRSTTRRAAAGAYWLSLLLFVAMSLSVEGGLTDWPTSYAVLGTLMGASYLWLFVWFDWRAAR